MPRRDGPSRRRLAQHAAAQASEPAPARPSQISLQQPAISRKAAPAAHAAAAKLGRSASVALVNPRAIKPAIALAHQDVPAQSAAALIPAAWTTAPAAAPVTAAARQSRSTAAPATGRINEATPRPMGTDALVSTAPMAVAHHNVAAPAAAAASPTAWTIAGAAAPMTAPDRRSRSTAAATAGRINEATARPTPSIGLAAAALAFRAQEMRTSAGPTAALSTARNLCPACPAQSAASLKP